MTEFTLATFICFTSPPSFGCSENADRTNGGESSTNGEQRRQKAGNYSKIPLYNWRRIEKQARQSARQGGVRIVAKAVKNAEKEEKAGKKRGGRTTAERKVAHSVNHPVRLDVLSILFERIASPNEMANQLRVALGTVSFHVTELVRDGVIELVKTEQRRGAIEHYYQARIRPEISDEELRKMPKATRRKMAALHLQAIVAEGLASLKNGKMDVDDDLNLIWMPMALDAKGRDRVSRLQAEVFEQLEEIRAEHTVASEDGEAPPTRIAAIMWYERGGLGRAMPPLPTD